MVSVRFVTVSRGGMYKSTFSFSYFQHGLWTDCAVLRHLAHVFCIKLRFGLDVPWILHYGAAQKRKKKVMAD